MRILFVLKHGYISGVNTFTWTCCSILRRSRPDVIVDVHIENSIDCRSEFLNEICRVSNLVSEEGAIKNEYDVVIFNYNSSTCLPIKSKIKKMIVHGLMAHDYEPSSLVDKILVMSERAMNFYYSYRPIKINNIVDESRFVIPDKSPDYNVSLVDIRCKNMLGSLVSKASCISGYGLVPVQDRWNVELEYQNSRVVIGYGRSVIEAMMCGKAAIVFGINGGDGVVNLNNIDSLMSTNFSGWTSRSVDCPFDTKDSRVISQLAASISEAMDMTRSDGFESSIRRAIMSRLDIGSTINEIISH